MVSVGRSVRVPQCVYFYVCMCVFGTDPREPPRRFCSSDEREEARFSIFARRNRIVRLFEIIFSLVTSSAPILKTDAPFPRLDVRRSSERFGHRRRTDRCCCGKFVDEPRASFRKTGNGPLSVNDSSSCHRPRMERYE